MKISSQSLSIATLLQQSSQQLQEISDSPLLDVQLLLADVLNKDRSYLMAWSEITPNQEQLRLFNHYLQQRLDGIPIAYILGHKEFWSLDLKVTPDVLIPRPETELLVEQAIEACSDIDKPTILELGTGSGAVAIALAKELPHASITATDLSIAALDIAHQNAHTLLPKQIQLLQSDWLIEIPSNAKFDLIISNPPYIKEGDAHLAGEIRHEPLQALTSGKDGLDAIKVIIENSGKHLNKNGIMMLEHGYHQATSIRQLMKGSGFKNCQTLKDYNTNDRLSIAHWM